MPDVLDLLAEAEFVASRLPATREAVCGLSDDELMEAQRRLAGVERRTGASAAAIAAEIGWRSRSELGHAGLAQRTGARTPESLVQQLTGSTGREAATLVRVGKVMVEAELLPPTVEPDLGLSDTGLSDTGLSNTGLSNTGRPDGAAPVETPAPWDGTGTAWLAPAGRAVAAGTLPVAAADAIRAGLGIPSGTVTVAQLTAATQRLVDEAARLHADALFRRARGLRDEIDAEGVAERERQRHAQRYLKVFRRQDGMVRIDGLLAPESGGAEVLETFQLISSPRRGGPRFVDAEEQARAQRILDDARTTEQLHADGLVELLRLGVAADPGSICGIKKPAVRVLVPADDLTTGTGVGRIEGHPDAISIDTVNRSICDSGILPIRFDDDGQCLNLGREQRLFTTKQRIALAARDGGCRFPGCERPPSWCEAHHLNEWHRHGGRTDLADGILLCRHHHLLIHNNHWQIQRHDARYFLIPPRERDPNQAPIELPSKSLALADLARRTRAG